LRGFEYCFFIRNTGIFLEAVGFHEAITDFREREHLVFAQLWEEHFTAITKDASQHTNLTTLFRRNKVTLHIARSSKRLFLLQTMNPAVRQRTV